MICIMKDLAAADNLLYNIFAEFRKNRGTACRGGPESAETEDI